MTWIIPGGCGLIGRAVIRALLAGPDPEPIYVLTRRKRPLPDLEQVQLLTYDEIRQNPALLPLKDAVICNLAGENIGAKRLTSRRIDELLDSRLNIITFFKDLMRSAEKPQLFIQASALGILADMDAEQDDDADSTSSLAPHSKRVNPCALMLESLEDHAQQLPCPCVCARLPLCLSSEAPLVQRLRRLPALRLLDGCNYLPCAQVNDCARALILTAEQHFIGTVNINAPSYITAQELLRALGSPDLPPLPCFSWMLRCAGRWDARFLLLLENKKVFSRRLTAAGMHFADPLAETGLRTGR